MPNSCGPLLELFPQGCGYFVLVCVCLVVGLGWFFGEWKGVDFKTSPSLNKRLIKKKVIGTAYALQEITKTFIITLSKFINIIQYFYVKPPKHIYISITIFPF